MHFTFNLILLFYCQREVTHEFVFIQRKVTHEFVFIQREVTHELVFILREVITNMYATDKKLKICEEQ